MNTFAKKNVSTTTAKAAKSANQRDSRKSTSAAAIAAANQSFAAAAQFFTSAAAAAKSCSQTSPKQKGQVNACPLCSSASLFLCLKRFAFVLCASVPLR